MSRISSVGRAPASQARCRALARAARISSRRLSSTDLITRWAVLSEATLPNSASWPRSTPRSLTQSPPSAIATARSRRTVPGSWAERRSRVGAIASLSAGVRPALSAISLSREAPAWEMRPSPSALTSTVWRVVCVFTFRVSSWLWEWAFANRILFSQEDAPGRFPQVLIGGSRLSEPPQSPNRPVLLRHLNADNCWISGKAAIRCRARALRLGRDNHAGYRLLE